MTESFNGYVTATATATCCNQTTAGRVQFTAHLEVLHKDVARVCILLRLWRFISFQLAVM